MEHRERDRSIPGAPVKLKTDHFFSTKYLRGQARAVASLRQRKLIEIVIIGRYLEIAAGWPREETKRKKKGRRGVRREQINKENELGVAGVLLLNVVKSERDAR